jgi:Holliday junction DNA helicase RuvA
MERGFDGCCVLDVSGVGYEVFVPMRSLGRLPTPPAATTLQVHTHVREDAFILYGFETAADRVAFRLLLGVSGVGPKLAMAVISELSATDLRTVIAMQDKKRLGAVSGVGKKIAERLVLELRDRVDLLGAGAAVATGTGASAPVTPPPTTRAGEAVGALVNLGFSRAEADMAVAKIATQDEDRPLEVVVRLALGTLHK